MEGPFRLDDRLVEPRLNEIVRQDRHVKLEPRVMQVLVYLAGRPSEIVSREDLLAAVWDGAFVADEVLTVAIGKLRRALEEDAKSPQFIQTVPGKGYRLNASVTPVVASPTRPARFFTRGRFLLAAAMATAVLMAAGFWRLQPFRPPVHSSVWGDPVPLTAFPGQESWPALSPDGGTLVFLWKPEGEETYDLYVKLIDEENPLRLTRDPANESSPTWSPDGRYLAFLREETRGTSVELESHSPETAHGIFVVPALGGPERRLGTTNSSAHGLSWSSDGEYLAVADKDSPGEPDAIFLIPTKSGDKKRLTRPPEDHKGDRHPVFAPDGESVAFIRGVAAPEEDLFVVAASGGEPVRLTWEDRHKNGLTWTSDGSGIVYASGPPPSSGGSRMWRISRDGRERAPEAVAPGEAFAYLPTIAGSGGKLAYQRRVVETNLWRAPGPLASSRDGSKTKLIASTGFDMMAAYSPDGRWIAFSSDRSGDADIWLTDSEGRNARSLVDWPETQLSPRWSPDGRHIVFYSFGWEGETGTVNPDRGGELYIVTVEGGSVRRLTRDPAFDVWPSWSRDGQSIYFFSNRGSREGDVDATPDGGVAPTRLDGQVWKIPASGGPAVQVTTGGGGHAVESLDGARLYFTRYHESGIWSVPVDGGEETLVIDHGLGWSWDLYANGICYVNADDPLRPVIECMDLTTRRIDALVTLDVPLARVGRVVVSPDGRWILYDQQDVDRADIMLLETVED